MSELASLKSEVVRLEALANANEWFFRALLWSMPPQQKAEMKKYLSEYVNDTSSKSLLKALPETHAELRRMFDSFVLALG